MKPTLKLIAKVILKLIVIIIVIGFTFHSADLILEKGISDKNALTIFFGVFLFALCFIEASFSIFWLRNMRIQ